MKYDLILSEKSSSELAWLIDHVNDSSELKECFKTLGPQVEEIWNDDYKQVKTSFWIDQLKNRPRSKLNRFSAITFRVALAVYYRSPAAYRALSAFDIRYSCTSIGEYYSKINTKK
eukprot:Pompholyxophrys_sp_v1_NODE_121_length_1773_cov_2.337602.p1 type:complete len:116 gc:universal NODE_121_length_1773_cov_2.337602:143-490(+)